MERKILLTYDITDDKIRNQIHKYLKNYGVNSQKSVFEIRLNDIEYRKLIDFFLELIPHDEKDSVRIYELCKSCFRNASIIGKGILLTQKDYTII